MAVFNRILFSQIKVAMMSWMIFTALMVIARFFIKNEAGFSVAAYTFIALGMYGALLIPKIYFIQGRCLSILKSTSKNNKSFWLRILVQNCILLSLAIFVALVLILVSRIKVPEDELRTLPLLFSPSGRACLFILAFILMCFSDCNQPLERLNQGMPAAKVQIKQLFLLFAGFGFLFSLSYIYNECSPLLALALGSSFILVTGLLNGDQFKKTLTRSNRLKAAVVGVVILACFYSVVGFYEQRVSVNSQFLLVDRTDWTFEDLKNVKNVEGWIIWQNRVESMDMLTTDQLLEMYEKLNQYCPPFRRDTALRFACYGTVGYKDYQYTSTKSRSEEDVVKLLNSTTEYGQVIGLMYARRLKKPLSKEVIVALERLAEKDSSIQTLARNTMTESYPTNFQYGFEIYTIKPD